MYSNESRLTLFPEDLETDALKNTTKYIRIYEPCTLVRVNVLVTVIADAAMTFTVTSEAIKGGTSTAIDTLTLPDTTAVGKVLYKDVEETDLEPGNVIKIVVSNTGTSTAVGLSATVIRRAEVPGNLTNMVASA